MSVQAIAGRLLFAMMALSMVNGIAPAAMPPWVPGACAWTAGILLIGTTRRSHRYQVATMLAVGGGGIVYAISRGQWGWWQGVTAGNQALLCMLVAVSFLRLVTRAPTGVAAKLPTGRGAIWPTLLAAHFLGAAINISALMIIGQRIAVNGRLTPLQARVMSRGFVAASFWSPFFVSLAVTLTYAPGARLYVVCGFGLVLAAVLLVFSAWDLSRDSEAARFVGFPIQPASLKVPLFLAAIVLAGHRLAPVVPVLTLVAGGSMLASLILLAGREGLTGLGRVRGHITRELSAMSAEVSLFLAAAVMAAGIGAAIAANHDIAMLPPFDAGIATLLLALLAALAVIGVHPVISIATVSILVRPGAMDPTLFGMTCLMCWGLGLVISPFSGTNLALQGRFGVRASRFFRWNLSYAAVGFVVSAALLHLYVAWTSGGLTG